jgi:2-oxoglutarate ferredoxin oxidoreductase subunit delta
MSRGRPEIDKEKCKGCALCVGVCPEGIMAMSTDQFNKQGLPFAVCTDTEKCTACQSCAIICPDAAIQVLKLVEARE